MSTSTDYPTYSEARAHLKEILDATAQGRTVTITRGKDVAALLPADRLREYFFRTVTPHVRVAKEGKTVAVFMSGRPFATEGLTIDEALDDLVVALREYVEDWEERLLQAPNHRDAWSLVQLVKLSDDAQLRDWFERGGETEPVATDRS